MTRSNKLKESNDVFYRLMNKSDRPSMYDGNCSCKNCEIMKSKLCCKRCMNYKELKYFDNVYILKYLEDLKIVKERNHYEICNGMCMDLSDPICIDCNGSEELDKKFCKKKRILHKKSGICNYCHKFCALTKDHIIPQSQIKINNIDNIALVCQHCNTSKSNKNIYTWRDTLNYEQQIIINKYLEGNE